MILVGMLPAADLLTSYWAMSSLYTACQAGSGDQGSHSFQSMLEASLGAFTWEAITSGSTADTTRSTVLGLSSGWSV
jgi:hypothetical protein